MHDLIIIGGGPAGVAGAVYAARKQLKTTLIAKEIGGQSTESLGIENWIGTKHISGVDLAKSFKEHLEAYKDSTLETVIGSEVVKLEKTGSGFTAILDDGKTYTARAVLIASGAARKKLQVPGAPEFENKGVTYCASCDGPLFSGQDVAVIGGGNAGFETAAQLLAYTKSVTLIHRRHDFKADPITVEKVLAHPGMTALPHTVPVKVEGGAFVTGLVVEDTDTNEHKTLPVSGIFVEIGVSPNTKFAEHLIDLDEIGRIKVDAKNQQTSLPGIWAAGDCTDELYHQNNIAAGDGVKALEDIYMALKAR